MMLRAMKKSLIKIFSKRKNRQKQNNKHSRKCGCFLFCYDFVTKKPVDIVYVVIGQALKNQEYLPINQIATENKNSIYTLNDYKEITGLSFIKFDDSINVSYRHGYGDFISFIVKISNGEKSIYCFQTIFPVSLIKRNRKIPLIRNGNTYSQTKDNIYVVESRVDFIIYSNELYVQNWKILQSKYSFNDYIDRTANKCIEKVKTLNIVEDLTKLLAEKEKTSISKLLMKAENSPVFSLSKDIIKERAINSVTYKKIIDENGNFVVNTAKKVKIFIKLLNDDVLISPLTNQEYFVNTKKGTDEEINE